MKILLINDYGIEIGGAETYLKNLKKALVKEGHDVRVLTSASSKDIASFSDYTFKGLNIKSPLRLIPYIFNFDAYMKVKKILKDFKPDVVHMHFTFYHTSPSILFALKNIPLAMTTHAHEILAPVGINYSSQCKHSFIDYCIKCTGLIKYYPELIKRIIFKKLSKRINLFIAPSKYYTHIHKKAGYSPIVTIYNGIIEKKVYKPVNVNKQNILFIGRLAPEKGADTIVRAMPDILTALPNTKLTIVGDGPESNKLKSLIYEYKLENNIKMVGKIPNKKTSYFYEQATLVIVPSLYPDNLPTVCIEAMNNGRALLVSNKGGLPELVNNGKNGYLFEPENTKDLANKTVMILSDKEKLKRLSMTSKIMLKNFSMEKHLKELIAQYNTLCKNI